MNKFDRLYEKLKKDICSRSLVAESADALEPEDFKVLAALQRLGFTEPPRNDWRAKDLMHEVSSEPVFRICLSIAKIGGYPLTCDVVKAADFQKADGTFSWYILIGLNGEYSLAQGDSIIKAVEDFKSGIDDFMIWVESEKGQLGLTNKQEEAIKGKILGLRDKIDHAIMLGTMRMS